MISIVPAPLNSTLITMAMRDAAVLFTSIPEFQVNKSHSKWKTGPQSKTQVRLGKPQAEGHVTFTSGIQERSPCNDEPSAGSNISAASLVNFNLHNLGAHCWRGKPKIKICTLSSQDTGLPLEGHFGHNLMAIIHYTFFSFDKNGVLLKSLK